ncbi:HNH endonuclease [Micromonospora carbonacea]|uniref:HNH endonuclease n=1 Tax=Micromonospora carbonacea TaxID=47853 RepID=A0A1C4WY01_9ACTN|nr:HNH endonuclease [Micromonospora carbonacea]SCF01147.1 HNH endonuclease [Micromonospora carbonacea]
MAVSRALRYQILRRDNHTCRYCGRSAPDVKLTVDHVVPEALGGSDEPTNLVTACAECNGGKSATPPDAALVAQVEEDAVRWARARHLAAQRALEDFQARQVVRDQFEQHWNRWKANGRPISLPVGWELTVDRFIAGGLPVPLLLEAVDIGMSRKVKADNIFNYVCGIAWNRVREIEQKAINSLSETKTEDDDSKLHAASFAGELLNFIGDHHGDEYYGEMMEIVQEDGDHSSEDLAIETARLSVEKLSFDFLATEGVMLKSEMLYWLLDPEHREPVDVESAEEIRARASHLITGAANQLATQLLDTLTEEQRMCWLKCAASAGIQPGFSSFRFAAQWYRSFTEISSVPARVCGLSTGEGLICGEPSDFIITVESCPLCPEECRGHRLCDAHATAAIDGKLASSGGTPLSVANVTEIDKNDPWR